MACIVAKELELGANPVIAAFLLDVVEDTPYSVDDLQTLFGKDVSVDLRMLGLLGIRGMLMWYWT